MRGTCLSRRRDVAVGVPCVLASAQQSYRPFCTSARFASFASRIPLPLHETPTIMTVGPDLGPLSARHSASTTLTAAVPAAVRAVPAAIPASKPTRLPNPPSPQSNPSSPPPNAPKAPILPKSAASSQDVSVQQDTTASTPPTCQTKQPTTSTHPPTLETPRSPESATIAAHAEPGAAKVFCVEDDERLTPMQHMAAGALAGMAEHMAMYPVDTIKTRMQSYVALRDFANLGMLHTTRTIISSEGVAALWRGVGAVALSAGPAHALYFATYESVREALAPTQRVDGDVHPVATAVAGACATIIGDGVMTPLDVVKQRMQLSARETYASVWQCARYVYSNHGVGAFYAGYKATLLMNVPFTAVYFSGYETAKKMILEWRGLDDAEFSVTSHCVAGAMAGAAAAAATNPLDVVKTRLQTQGEVGARRYRGLTDALRSIRVEEGLGGLMRGVRPRVLFHMPAAAVCWTTYEFCKHVMNRAGLQGRDGVRLG